MREQEKKKRIIFTRRDMDALLKLAEKYDLIIMMKQKDPDTLLMYTKTDNENTEKIYRNLIKTIKKLAKRKT